MTAATTQAPVQLYTKEFPDQVSLIRRRVSQSRHGWAILPSRCFPLVSVSLSLSGTGYLSRARNYLISGKITASAEPKPGKEVPLDSDIVMILGRYYVLQAS